MISLGQRLILPGLNIQVAVRNLQSRDTHAVMGQRAGLVDAQHGGLPQRLDTVQLPGQHLMLRQTARAQGHEHNEDNRELLRQDAHGQSDATEQAGQPIAAQPPVQQSQTDTEQARQQREASGQAGHFLAQR